NGNRASARDHVAGRALAGAAGGDELGERGGQGRIADAAELAERGGGQRCVGGRELRLDLVRERGRRGGGGWCGRDRAFARGERDGVAVDRELERDGGNRGGGAVLDREGELIA